MPYADPEARREYQRKRRQDPAVREAEREYHRRYRQVPARREAESERQRKRYAPLRAEARWWLGGRCLHCGATEGLEFDHTDPATKSFEVTEGWSRSPRAFFDELEKCQLLCRPCHLTKTREDRERAKLVSL